jgi:hypothetical protein
VLFPLGWMRTAAWIPERILGDPIRNTSPQGTLNRVSQSREGRSGNLSNEACLALGTACKKLEHLCPKSAAYDGNWRKQAISPACAFTSPFSASMSAIEIFRQLRVS